MYEHVEIKEPTGPGKWWRRDESGCLSIHECYQTTFFYPDNEWAYTEDQREGSSIRLPKLCKEEGVTWTGSIPEPECKPARGRPARVEDGQVETGFGEDKPTTSDEELGRICLDGCDFKCRCCTPDQCVDCVPEGVQFFAGVAAIRAKLAGG